VKGGLDLSHSAQDFYKGKIRNLLENEMVDNDFTRKFNGSKKARNPSSDNGLIYMKRPNEDYNNNNTKKIQRNCVREDDNSSNFAQPKTNNSKDQHAPTKTTIQSLNKKLKDRRKEMKLRHKKNNYLNESNDSNHKKRRFDSEDEGRATDLNSDYNLDEIEGNKFLRDKDNKKNNSKKQPELL
jgi:hypothetical protein